MGGAEHRSTAKEINKHRITARKVNETPSPQHVFLAPWFESTLKIILLYLNNFPQNKHITTLFIAHMSILLMPVNRFSCSCEETSREARKRTKKKREEPQEMAFTPDRSLLLLRSLFLVYKPTD